MAIKDDWKVLSAAHRGGVGICGARRVDDSLLVGKGRRDGTCSVRRVRGERERQGRARRFVPAERLRIVRHRGERGRVGGGLLEFILPRRAQRRIGVERRLLDPRSPGRIVRRQGDRRTLLCAFSLRRGRPVLRQRLSGGARLGLTRGASAWKYRLGFWVHPRAGRRVEIVMSGAFQVRGLSGVGACDRLLCGDRWASNMRGSGSSKTSPPALQSGKRPSPPRLPRRPQRRSRTAHPRTWKPPARPRLRPRLLQGRKLRRLTPDEICKRDGDRFAQLRSSPTKDEAQRFAKELGCEKLRPQLLGLIESLENTAPPPATSEVPDGASLGAKTVGEATAPVPPSQATEVAAPPPAAAEISNGASQDAKAVSEAVAPAPLSSGTEVAAPPPAAAMVSNGAPADAKAVGEAVAPAPLSSGTEVAAPAPAAAVVSNGAPADAKVANAASDQARRRSRLPRRPRRRPRMGRPRTRKP